MKPPQPLQLLIDPFVREFGGQVVADLIGANPTTKNADYVFRSHNVIAELKALENNTFSEAYRRKLGVLMGDWDRRVFLRVYGMQRIDSSRLNPICQNELFDLMGKPFQDNFIAKANTQIEQTKEFLKMPVARR